MYLQNVIHKIYFTLILLLLPITITINKCYSQISTHNTMLIHARMHIIRKNKGHVNRMVATIVIGITTITCTEQQYTQYV